MASGSWDGHQCAIVRRILRPNANKVLQRDGTESAHCAVGVEAIEIRPKFHMRPGVDEVVLVIIDQPL